MSFSRSLFLYFTFTFKLHHHMKGIDLDFFTSPHLTDLTLWDFQACLLLLVALLFTNLPISTRHLLPLISLPITPLIHFLLTQLHVVGSVFTHLFSYHGCHEEAAEYCYQTYRLLANTLTLNLLFNLPPQSVIQSQSLLIYLNSFRPA